ncbi:MAG TPA: class I SAM-dependent methyltransferase [Nitrososphaerales archaeon]|nr:class I SAM-dependent methyltransferase [Nitrososphaerales archaeon]
MIVKSEIIEDSTSKNALHKLETKYAWIYDLIYPDFLPRIKKQNDILIEKLRTGGNKDILELGSGSARQSWLLNREGYNSQALDLSPQMVELAQKKIGKDRAQLGDARSFKTDTPAGAIVIGPLVTCFFLDNKDLSRTLDCAYQSLANGGLLLCEFIAADHILKDPFYNGFSKQEFKISQGKITRFHESRLDLQTDAKYDWFSTYIFDLKDGLSIDTDDVLLRAYFPSEVELFFDSHGFEILDEFGFDTDEFVKMDKAKNKTTLLFLAQKRR